MTSKFSFLLIAGMIVFFNSCDKDHDPINEEELITTLVYTLTPRDGGDIVTLSFKDLDGDGGNAPTITSGTLKSGKTYDGVLNLLNESVTPADVITTEIQEEAEEQTEKALSPPALFDAGQFCLSFTPSLGRH